MRVSLVELLNGNEKFPIWQHQIIPTRFYCVRSWEKSINFICYFNKCESRVL